MMAVQHNLRASLRESGRYRPAEAGAGARDQRHLPGQ
jgi:hypothetical protein